MKKIVFLAAIGVFPFIAQSQIEVETETLDGNNTAITLSDGGVFLSNPYMPTYGYPTLDMYEPGFEFPKGSGKHVMNGLSMWFGGVDEFDEPRVSAPTITAYEDQFPGPLSNNSLTPYFGGFGSFYAVSKEEIDYHITNYQNPNYIMPAAIADWPAHGDPTIGMDFYLAPFVDTDGDGYYNPYWGDYPCIKGDEAVYMVMNDRQAQYACGGPRNFEGMGIEIHFMYYQFTAIPELANTTFCETRVINRSSENYQDFSASLYMNAGIGSSSDDFFGTDISRDMIYAYNGEETDQDYGVKPPAVGVVSLNNKIDRSRVFGEYPNYGYHFPSFPPEFAQVMQGKLLTGENYPHQFGYPGDPIESTGDIQSLTEQAHSMIYTIDIGDFNSGEEREFDFAIVVGQGESNLGSIKNLREATDFAHLFYDETSEGGCVQGTIGIPDDIPAPAAPLDDVFTSIYPNPSHGEFILEVEKEWMGADVTVFNTNGLVLTGVKNISELRNTLKVTNGPGVYLVSLEKDGVSKILKAVVE